MAVLCWEPGVTPGAAPPGFLTLSRPLKDSLSPGTTTFPPPHAAPRIRFSPLFSQAGKPLLVLPELRWPESQPLCPLHTGLNTVTPAPQLPPPGGELQETVCGASTRWGWRQAVHKGASGAGTAKSGAPGPSPELLFL